MYKLSPQTCKCSEVIKPTLYVNHFGVNIKLIVAKQRLRNLFWNGTSLELWTLAEDAIAPNIYTSFIYNKIKDYV